MLQRFLLLKKLAVMKRIGVATATEIAGTTERECRTDLHRSDADRRVEEAQMTLFALFLPMALMVADGGAPARGNGGAPGAE